MRPEAGNTISVYTWRATYDDGTQVTPIPGIGYADINRDKLRVFELIHKESKEPKLRVNFLPGQRLIWRKRVAMHSDGNVQIVHIVGKQQTVDGQNKQGIALLFERDGSVEFFDRFDPKHPFLQEIELLPFEV